MYKLLTVILCVVAFGHAHPTVAELGFRLNERNSNGIRIVGGEPANLGEFPYQISYQINGEHLCGGTILTKNVVLTAAHCVTEVLLPPGFRTEIVAGIVSLKNESEYVQRIAVSESLVHPDFTGEIATPNDLALFYLNDSLVFNENVQPILLPENNTIPNGTVTLSGWGSISNHSITIFPDNLQKVDLPILSQEDCKNALKPSDSLLADTNICTGPVPGDLGACSGDSGGPLVVKGNGNTTIVGIVSWGFVPCGHDKPSIYTRVSAFVDFINQNLGN